MCETPKKAQIDDIENVLVHDKKIIGKWRTGFGKSMVPWGVATMRHSVTIIMMPLLALSSDQTTKFNKSRKTHSIYVLHADEVMGSTLEEVKQRTPRALFP